MNFRISIFICVFLCLTSASPLAGADEVITAEISSDIAQNYVRANRLVDVGGGRRMNLYCRGDGQITVIFDSGLSDWSSIWALVQPAVATRTRACTYDRAGMGYSDLSNRPSTPFNIVDDLRNLIKVAGIQAPIVLVGHSLGGFNMKLFAATHPSEVAGLVLVDPAEERGNDRVGAQVSAKFGEKVNESMNAQDVTDTKVWLAQLHECAKEAKKRDLDPSSELYKECTDPVRLPLGTLIANERQAIQVREKYQVAQESEASNSVNGNNPLLDQQYKRIFDVKNALGKIPLIVLSKSIVNVKNPFGKEGQFAWVALHEQTAASSTRGIHRIVPDSRHNIEIDQPQAIVEAINDVLKATATAQ